MEAMTRARIFGVLYKRDLSIEKDVKVFGENKCTAEKKNKECTFRQKTTYFLLILTECYFSRHDYLCQHELVRRA